MKVEIDLASQKIQDQNPFQQTTNPDIEVFRQPVMKWSDETAWNYREEVIIRPGMNLYIENNKNPEASYRFDIDQAPLEMGILLSGQSNCHLKGDDGSRKCLTVNSGTSMITYSPKATGIQEMGPQPLVSVGIYIDPEMLHGYLGNQDDCLPNGFKDIINGRNPANFFQFVELTDELRNVALQVLRCSFKGAARRLFLESKALEIMALQTSQFGHLSKPVSSVSEIAKRDINKLQEARDILTRSFKTPPSLFELSKSVGMSHTKLNQGFRKMYGRTVFDYLRHIRLEYARLLLLDTELTITEIAFDSGFSDSSHFSRHFLQAFGCRPSIYRTKN